MRILDRERYWAFFKAYVICFTALVGLYIVIDAFSNFDEFTKRADGRRSRSFAIMGRFYLVHMSRVLRPALRRHRHDGGDLHRHLDAEEQRAARHARRGDQHPAGDPAGHRLVGARQRPGRRQPGTDHARVRRGAPEVARRRRRRARSSGSPAVTTPTASTSTATRPTATTQTVLLVQRHVPRRDLRRDPRARGRSRRGTSPTSDTTSPAAGRLAAPRRQAQPARSTTRPTSRRHPRQARRTTTGFPPPSGDVPTSAARRTSSGPRFVRGRHPASASGTSTPRRST